MLNVFITKCLKTACHRRQVLSKRNYINARTTESGEIWQRK
jgi:hypothetical protein